MAVDSQNGARRNAMIANSSLAARRAEREDVEDFLAAREAQRVAAVESAEQARAQG